MRIPHLSLLAVAGWTAVILAAPFPPHLDQPLLGPPPEPPARPLALPRGAELAGAVVTPVTVTPSSREESRNFFNTVYAASNNASPAWNGAYETCEAGTTAASFREAVVRRINYFRAMAGVPADVALAAEYNDKAQQAALMMSANTNLNHYPAPTWLCYSSAGAEAAGKANLAIGTLGPEAIDGYMEDPGEFNASVGHRRWLLYPQTRLMGTGDVPGDASRYAANAVWVLDNNVFGARPATRDDFVAWPPPGFVPYPLVFPRWSLSYPNADFTKATVTVTQNGSPLAVQVEPASVGAGENSLVWVMPDVLFAGSNSHPPTSADVAYAVEVAGVKVGNATRSFSYVVTVFDPARPGTDTVRPSITGPATVQVGQPASFTFTPVPKADAHEARLSRSVALNITEGAEDNLINFDRDVSPGYPVVVSSPRYSGSYAMRLTHLSPARPQVLTYRKTLLPAANASVTFRSRLGYASEGQHARVQVSTDYGGSWTTIYSQSGTSTAGESSFQSRTASLAEFAGRSLLLRLVYDYSGGPYYADTATHVGWVVDDLRFINCAELTVPMVVTVPAGNTFNIVPTAAVAHVLEVRALVFGGLPLEWGPAFPLAVQNGPVLSVALDVPALVNGQLHINFTATATTPTTQFTLLRRANVASGEWTTDASATLVKLGGASFRFVTPPPLGAAFFKVRAQ
ncbi:MAG: CAP domain-containing protein [Verrucomicrobia bacterium]|nr:CAP domain-containing protein [Verrucomicrobiota bacterium]